jgi:hypothetical protein
MVYSERVEIVIDLYGGTPWSASITANGSARGFVWRPGTRADEISCAFGGTPVSRGSGSGRNFPGINTGTMDSYFKSGSDGGNGTVKVQDLFVVILPTFQGRDK